MLQIEGFGFYIDIGDRDRHVRRLEEESIEEFEKRTEIELVNMFPPDFEKIVFSSYFIEPSKLINSNTKFSELKCQIDLVDQNGNRQAHV